MSVAASAEDELQDHVANNTNPRNTQTLSSVYDYQQ